MLNRTIESGAGVLGAGDGVRRRWLVSASVWGMVPALALGLCLGCGGGGDESKLAGPPEGMELVKPVPPPPHSAEDALGSASDPASQTPPAN